MTMAAQERRPEHISPDVWWRGRAPECLAACRPAHSIRAVHGAKVFQAWHALLSQQHSAPLWALRLACSETPPVYSSAAMYRCPVAFQPAL